MSEPMGFDSLEEMFAFMQAQEAEANEHLRPEQAEIRDDWAHDRWWVRPYPEAGCLIFGEAWSRERVEAREPEAASHLREMRERGYLFGMAYSVLEPDGEPGDTHVANLMPISEQAFNEAKTHGWQAIAPDPLAELMVPAEVLAERTTPTLVAELRAIDEGRSRG